MNDPHFEKWIGRFAIGAVLAIGGMLLALLTLSPYAAASGILGGLVCWLASQKLGE